MQNCRYLEYFQFFIDEEKVNEKSNSAHLTYNYYVKTFVSPKYKNFLFNHIDDYY